MPLGLISSINKTKHSIYKESVCWGGRQETSIQIPIASSFFLTHISGKIAQKKNGWQLGTPLASSEDHILSRAWWRMFVIPVLVRLRPEDPDSRPASAT